LLAGTRPQVNPFQPDTTGQINGDVNVVWGAWPGQNPGAAYTFPNSLADGNDTPALYVYQVADPNDANNTLTEPLIQRTPPPGAGRGGEAAATPGVPFRSAPAPAPANLVQPFYANPVRAGYSFDTVDLFNNMTYNGTLYPFPRDAADDNTDAFDIFPPRI